MSLDLAIEAERDSKIMVAADAYEQCIKDPRLPLGALLNLIVLYWQATDPGFSAAHHLPTEFVSRAGHRLPQILSQAVASHPHATEARFWQRYIAWADLGQDLPVSWCEDLLREDPTCLVPAIYPLSQGVSHPLEAAGLLAELENESTARAKYVTSVIQAALRNQGRTRG